MNILSSERPNFTIEDPQEASASSDAEDESNGVTGVITEFNKCDDAVDKNPTIEENSETIPDAADVGDTKCSTKEPSPNSLISQSENNSASGLTAKAKPKTSFRTATSYTQHILTQPADIIEYEWPEKSGEYYFVQEQISQLLDVKSFKRKYPDLARRNIESDEREFLTQNKNIVNLLSIHLLNHLTALRSVEVLDLMSAEYPAIHSEYQKVVSERRKQALIEKQKELDLIKSDAKKLEELRKKAIKSAMKYNQELQTTKKSERKFFLDTQTSIIQSAANRWCRLPASETRPSAYPVALIPGQFSSHYKKFSAKELYAMPFNTIMANDQLFVPKRERSPSPIHVADREGARTEKNDEMEVDVKNEVVNTETVVEKATPLRGRRPSATTVGGPTPKKPRKNSSITNKAMLSEAIAAMSTPVKNETAPIMPPSPLTIPNTLHAASNNAGNRPGEPVVAAIPPPMQYVQQHSPIPEEANEPNGSAENGGETAVDTENDANDGSDDEDRRCIVCNLHETDIPTHALAVDLGRTQTQTPFVRCADCGHEMHAGCIDMSPSMVEAVRSYAWRCAECKECFVCGKQDQEEAMMCCDLCDRGYHTFCTGITVPPSGQFVCVKCRD